MATTRYKGANSSERLTLSTLSDSDMFQTRHLPGTVNDADKGVSKSLLQALPIAVCATAAATAAKVATLAPESCPDFSLVNGRTVHIYFSAANTASVPTLNLAGTGAIPITYPDGSYVGEWPAGCCLDLMYISIVDGNTAIERWVLVSSLPVDEVTANNMQSVTSNAVAEVIYTSLEVVTGFNTSYVGNSYVTKIVIGNICVISGWIEVINNIPFSAAITNANTVPATSAQYARGMLQGQGNCRGVEITTDGKISVPNTSQAVTVGYWDINIVYPC